MSIGENIKKYRKDRKITQIQLARMIYKSESTIQKYESDLVTPNIEILGKIAEALDVTLASLITTDGNSFSVDLISAIQTAYIRENEGLSPRDIFQVLSNDLELDYEVFNCFKPKKTIAKTNNDGSYTYTDIDNDEFDNTKELPIDLQIKLLIYLSETDYREFLKFTGNKIYIIKTNPVLDKTLKDIKQVRYFKRLYKDNPNDKRIFHIIEKLNSPGELTDEDLETIDMLKFESFWNSDGKAFINKDGKKTIVFPKNNGDISDSQAIEGIATYISYIANSENYVIGSEFKDIVDSTEELIRGKILILKKNRGDLITPEDK
ncbi:helix-turn-helix domain-containing protein [Clostridium algidicarnis]|uniref:helix-turn-helix domain-containing protein n=1 Tax=Clostridium algidicarnis TaxID=37659 RepID=UPI001C0C83B2|nr:helix-turn-helix domain-containing protein [Clostridium algidicarnis]MBU3203741.1 helix-turn-helix domain-containing protein [Clostridium algidicarnis]MBU3211895.1 helix-turn-helix domain-containing protein [Clostridium algidicarnis]MBU3221599.1 helix-turn-helix domain-containing protein [Clostridium algidicarnis]